VSTVAHEPWARTSPLKFVAATIDLSCLSGYGIVLVHVYWYYCSTAPLLSTIKMSTHVCRSLTRASKSNLLSFLVHQTRFKSAYAAVDHGMARETALRGLHGRQLKLAEVEGYGKDDADFDPFIEDEIEEDKLRLGEEAFRERYNKQDKDEDDEIFSSFTKQYNNDGSIRRSKSQLVALRAGAPAGGLIAIVELAGSQHKVTTDDVLIVNRLNPVTEFAVGSTHTFKDNVMLVGSSHYTLVGMPYVAGAEVDVMVEEITMDSKVVVFKKRRRKNSQRKTGFRRDVTMLRILDIRPPVQYESVDIDKRIEPELPPTTADVLVGVQ